MAFNKSLDSLKKKMGMKVATENEDSGTEFGNEKFSASIMKRVLSLAGTFRPAKNDGINIDLIPTCAEETGGACSIYIFADKEKTNQLLVQFMDDGSGLIRYYDADDGDDNWQAFKTHALMKSFLAKLDISKFDKKYMERMEEEE